MATPRKYFAVLYKYCEIKDLITESPRQDVLVGKDALNALSGLVSRIK